MEFMKKLLLSLLLFVPIFVLAEGELEEDDREGCRTITVSTKELYYYCNENDHVNKGNHLGATYNEETNTLLIENGDVYSLVIENFPEINVEIKGETVINETGIKNSKVNISGEGTLYLGYENLAFTSLQSEVLFNGVNVMVEASRQATPPSDMRLAGARILPDLPSNQSLFNVVDSNITFKDSDLDITSNLYYGIYLADESNLTFKSSDVNISGTGFGIYAEDSGLGSTITDYDQASSVTFNNSNVSMIDIQASGLYLFNVESDDSNLEIVGTGANRSSAIWGTGRYSFSNSNVKLKNFEYGLYITDSFQESRLKITGGSLDVNVLDSVLLYVDEFNAGAINVDTDLILLNGQSLTSYQSCSGDDCVTVYSFGANVEDIPGGAGHFESSKVLLLKAYENISILDGDGQQFYLNKIEGLTFKINRDSQEYFEKVLLNNQELDASMYTIDGNVVTIKADALNRLEIGNYTITVKYTEGEAVINFSIVEEPKNPYTGDLLGYVIIAGMVLLICTAFIMMKRSWVSE